MAPGLTSFDRMARPAKTAAGQTPRETDGVHLVAIPRLWLTALVVLFVAPWVVVAVFYRGGRPQADAVSARSVPAAAAHAADAAGNVGPWGRLEVTPITISPPAEYIPRTWGPVAAPEWHFPGMTADAVAGFLASAGVSPDDIQRLRATARPEPLNRGVVVRPDIGDAHHIGRARCAKRHASNDDDALAGSGESVAEGDAAGAIHHVVLIVGVFGDDAMHAPHQR